MVNAGRFKKGDKIKLALKSDNGEELEVTDAYIYYEDFDALKEFYDSVSAEKCSLEKITSSHLKGNYTSSTGCIMFSIPYDEGWNVKADGKILSAQKIHKAAGELLSVDVPTGSHEIDLQFRSPGAAAGISITCIFALLLTIYIVYVRKMSKKNKKSF